MADSHPLVYYFPQLQYVRDFYSINDAYDFINEAFEKIESVSGKTAEKGLAARLVGQSMPANNSLIVVSQIVAFRGNKAIDMSKMSIEEIEEQLKNAISVYCLFMVFYEGRGVSISRYYLKKNYRYVNNAQQKTFILDGIEYKADYPIGWGVEKAFLYLKKLIE